MNIEWEVPDDDTWPLETKKNGDMIGQELDMRSLIFN